MVFLDRAEDIRLTRRRRPQPAAGIEEITDLFHQLHLTDGLPIIPPTPARLDKMLCLLSFATGAGAGRGNRSQRKRYHGQRCSCAP